MGRAGVARSPRRTNARLMSAYEQACEHGEGGAYLRREGLYSSLISEWRKQRDAGVLAGKRRGEKVGRLSAEQAEIARLTRELARANKRLSTTDASESPGVPMGTTAPQDNPRRRVKALGGDARFAGALGT